MVWLTPDEEEDFEERVGILEFDGGLSRARSEQVARAMVLDRRDSLRQSKIACAIGNGNDRVTA